MILPEDYICPTCGLVLDSLTAFHRHYKKEHELRRGITYLLRWRE